MEENISPDHKIYKSIFFIALLLHISLSFFVGFNHSVLDFHGFRQSQTAITAFYFNKEGIDLIHYQIPVFGPPWQVPLEFPIFQTIVSLLFKILPLNLEEAGRLTSLLAFYGFIFFVFKILNQLYEDCRIAFSSVTLILVSPIYLFWSRTFMIETLVLMFASVYAYLIIKSKDSSSDSALRAFFIVLFGCLTSLSKITTFLTLLPVIILLIAFYQRRPSLKILNKKMVLQLALYIGIPFLLGFIWTKYSDSVKVENPLTVYLSSKNLNAWNFGTLKEKLSPSHYAEAFFYQASLFFKAPLQVRSLLTGNLSLLLKFLSATNFVLIGLYLFICFKVFVPFNFRRLVLLVSYLGGIAVFTNLYFIHHYYWTACTFFLSILIAVTIQQTIKNNYFKTIIFLLALVASIGLYSDLYFQLQNKQKNPPQLCNEIKKNTKDADWILIYNGGWSSEIPFYAERKSIMVKDSSFLDEFDTLSNRIDTKRIKAILVGENKFQDLSRYSFIRDSDWKKVFTDNYALINYTMYLRDSSNQRN